MSFFSSLEQKMYSSLLNILRMIHSYGEYLDLVLLLRVRYKGFNNYAYECQGAKMKILEVYDNLAEEIKWFIVKISNTTTRKISYEEVHNNINKLKTDKNKYKVTDANKLEKSIKIYYNDFRLNFNKFIKKKEIKYNNSIISDLIMTELKLESTISSSLRISKAVYNILEKLKRN